MTDGQIQLSIVIASWNVKDLLRNCLQSIRLHLKNVSHEIIVIDNASSDGSADMVAKEFPTVQLIRNKQNVGFGRANNQGLARVQGKFVLFLNDDTQLTDSKLINAIQYLESHPQVGLVGFRLLNPDGSQQASVRTFPHLWDQLLYLLKLHVLFPRAKALRRYLAQDFDYSKESKVDQVMGAAMLVNQKLIKELNGFDPGFPNWFEEVDLCQRIHQKGLDVMYLPIAEIIHVKGASFAQHRPLKLQRVFNYSMRRYFKKWESIPAYLIITLAQPISLFGAIVVDLFDRFGFNLRRAKAKHL